MWRRRRWKELFGDVGSAFMELIQTEIGTLVDDLMRSRRDLASAFIWVVVAASFGVWTVGLLVVVAVSGLALWMDVWAAALLIATVLLIISATASLIAWRHLRRFDRPGRLIKERWEDHVDWWRTEIVGHDGALGPTAGDTEVDGERHADAS